VLYDALGLIAYCDGMDTNNMKRIAITGGIASGKSLLGQWLSETLHYPVIDSDATVHQLLADDAEVIQAVTSRFGAQVCCPSTGGVLRPALVPLVFGDSDAQQENKRWLEALLHPRVHEARAAFFAQHAELTHAFALIPLLFETMSDTHIASSFEASWLVAAPPEVQLQRMMEHRGMREAEALARIQSQYPLEVKQQRATHTLWNNGTPEALFAQARALV
jgi:dephospho-CoA kinase